MSKRVRLEIIEMTGHSWEIEVPDSIDTDDTKATYEWINSNVALDWEDGESLEADVTLEALS